MRPINWLPDLEIMAGMPLFRRVSFELASKKANWATGDGLPLRPLSDIHP